MGLRTDSVDCHVSDPNNIICDGEEILRNEAAKQYKLTLYLNPPVETNELSFFLNATTATESIQVGNTLNMLLNLKREADFLITG